MCIERTKLLDEYRKEKMRADKLAVELSEAKNRLDMANRELEEVSFRDYLTGLYNRRYLFDFLDKELRRSERYGVCLSLIVYDIDHFKKINDVFGHLSGDLVLKSVSNRVMATKRLTDILARYGGEEFVLVLPQTNLHGAFVCAERLRKEIEALEITIEDRTMKVTVSIGVAACCPKKEKTTADRLIDLADKALYTAKNSGRNRVVAAND